MTEVTPSSAASAAVSAQRSPFFLRLPAQALIALVRLYQRAVSPALPALFGPTCGCRFAPTCSHYAIEAIQTHGAFAGTWLALRRLVKCTPFHSGGFDPVPPSFRSPRCTRLAPQSSSFTPANFHG
jgi:uncharacterized protein